MTCILELRQGGLSVAMSRAGDHPGKGRVTAAWSWIFLGVAGLVCGPSCRSSYVTAADFAAMASAGVNAVRLPLGYWALAVTADDVPPFVPGAWACIDTAMQWGLQYGIGESSRMSVKGRSTVNNCSGCLLSHVRWRVPVALASCCSDLRASGGEGH